MGCDIHMYAEKQVSNNTDIYWEMIGDIFLNEYYDSTKGITEYNKQFIDQPYTGRNYVFG